MAIVETQTRDRVLEILVDNPPVSALGAAVRTGLLEAIGRAMDSPDVAAIVIRCRGRTFFAGADINEFGKPAQPPSLPEVVSAIETCPKPVVAAIHGTALGGGLEVALGCHYRLAVASAKLGLPEVKLGILPGAGGTQRLPRLIGVEPALEMIVTGDAVSAQRALALGLVDKVVEDDLEGEALRYAEEIAGASSHPIASRRTDKIKDVDPEVFTRFRRQNAKRLRGLDAPEACVQAVQAAVEHDFTDGARIERELFLKLRDGPQSKALRHVFFAERAAARVDDLPADTPTSPIAKVGVIGAGTMGGGIAIALLSAGLAVVIVERESAALDRGVANIRKTLDGAVTRGKMSPEKRDAAVGRLTPSLTFENLADCDLVIEAVFEDMDVKKDVFSRLDAIMKPGAILASNTSYLDLNEIARATARPQDVIGLRFFSPANIMRLLEVVRGEKTSATVLASCMKLAKTIGKVAVVAGVCDGFIGNRMLKVRREEALRLVLQGATPWRVDQVMLDFGFPMGPFQIADLAGLDIGWRAETSRGETLRDALCERGRRGQKTDAGYYDYDEKRNRTPSPEVEAIVAAYAARSGLPQPSFTDQDILERLLYPMVSEGAAILDEKVAQRAGDIDIVWLNGYGWPAQTGGPMFWADSVGLACVLEGIERRAGDLAPTFTTSDLLRRKAARGETFN